MAEQASSDVTTGEYAVTGNEPVINDAASGPHKHRVVIIGSGFGGLAAAQEFKGNDDVEVTVVARTGHHLFQPLLYQVATGILSVGEIAPSTRMILRDQDNARVVLGDVEKIDVETKTLYADMGHISFAVEYDSLIVAAGAGQSYFGNDQFEVFAPGMKTIDDALELRSRILGCFEQAEITEDPEERRRLLTFVIVGAGPTGVEMAGQVAELAHKTLKDSFRAFDPAEARVLLIDAAPLVLPPFGEQLGGKARAALEKIGVEVQLNAMVQNVDYDGIEVKYKDGRTERIHASCKIWSAGVSASPLGTHLAEQTGAETDRSGRVKVREDFTLPGQPNVFLIGDMVNLNNWPGVAPFAQQGGKYVARLIANEIEGAPPAQRKPFKYFDKGSMATVSRYSAVVKVGKFQFSGFLAWLVWLAVHLATLVGFRNRFMAIISWGMQVNGNRRAQLTSTKQWAYGRQAMRHLEEAK